MEYKGYKSGIVTLDESAGVFTGEVVGLKDVITFQGTTLKEVQEAFRVSVDDYLDFCKEKGKCPDYAYSGQFIVRVSTNMHRAISECAAKSGISLNAWITNVLENIVK